MGSLEARMAAGTWAALVLRRPLAGLPSLGDLPVVVSFRRLCAAYLRPGRHHRGRKRISRVWRSDRRFAVAGAAGKQRHHIWRSEEHTSELQSLMRISYAVFCLKK